MKYVGKLPRDLGPIDLAPSEMMFWMYCPISMPGMDRYYTPDNLRQFGEIVSAVKADDPGLFERSYVYLTAKTLWVEGNYIGNRPGWHIDGYGTEDVNYIWSDRSPTEFIGMKGIFPWLISEDCHKSMDEMEAIGREGPKNGIPIVTYPPRHLLCLDNTVIHRSPVKFDPGIRTFVKVSLSADRYNLKGNSRNYHLPESRWPLIDRQLERNHPACKDYK